MDGSNSIANSSSYYEAFYAKPAAVTTGADSHRMTCMTELSNPAVRRKAANQPVYKTPAQKSERAALMSTLHTYLRFPASFLFISNSLRLMGTDGARRVGGSAYSICDHWLTASHSRTCPM